MRLYLDICAIQRPLDDQSILRTSAEAEAVRSLLALCEQGHLELLTSVAHIIENSRNPHTDRRDFAAAVIGRGQFIPNTPEVEALAEEYVQNGVAPLDAVHLASAVHAEASFFCTTDDDLLRKGRKADTRVTVVVSPLELVARIP